jgi:hypothetical protein
MSSFSFRWLGFGLVASAGAGLLALTSMMNSAFAYGTTTDAADPDIGLVMGGSGDPLVTAPGVDFINSLYIEPNFPGVTFPGTLANGLFTPEGLYPITGVKSLPFNYPLNADGFPAQSTSVGQGLTILNDAIQANLAAGDTTTVFGDSQSSTISSLEMEQLDPSGTPSQLPVNFVLTGDPSNPNGGLLERFDVPAGTDPSVPSLGVSFDGATPADSFPTVIYTLEYDGFAGIRSTSWRTSTPFWVSRLCTSSTGTPKLLRPRYSTRLCHCRARRAWAPTLSLTTTTFRLTRCRIHTTTCRCCSRCWISPSWASRWPTCCNRT